ncbi:hypothetical protein LCGC14_1538870, partial [marine sediment metagenome]
MTGRSLYGHFINEWNEKIYRNEDGSEVEGTLGADEFWDEFQIKSWPKFRDACVSHIPGKWAEDVREFLTRVRDELGDKVQFAQISVPEGWIDFAIGQPHVDILPLEQITQAAEHRFKQGDRNILQYGMQQGSANFRTTLSQFLSKKYSLAVDPDHLLITAGISQALDQICSLHTKPGDTVIVEEPSYFLALRIFTDHKLKIVGTPIDENGLIM